MKRAVALLASIAVLVGATGQKAQAGYLFNVGNQDIQNVTASDPSTATSSQLVNPYADISVLADSTAGTVKFVVTAAAHNALSPPDAVFSQIAFNTNLQLGTDFNIVASQSDGDIAVSHGSVSDFGTFDYVVGAASNGSRFNPYQFVLTLAFADPSQATVNNFVQKNSDGYYFAAHIFTNIPPSGVTGFIASNGAIGSVTPPPGGVTAVPAPPTALLALFGLPGFAAAAWARRRRVAVA